jgi:hypothetical protein
MNKQVKSHWKLAWCTFKTALKVTFSVPYRIHKANLFQLLVTGKIERQREAFAMFSNNDVPLPMHKSTAVIYLEFLDSQIKNVVTLKEKELLQQAQKKYLQIFGISKNDLDNGYFLNYKKQNKALRLYSG